MTLATAGAEPHAYRARILPVAGGTARPSWSVMIPTYHCAAYLREALESVLAQDPGGDEMQIEVVDDHSTRDRPDAVVAEIGRGRVGFHRQERNVGHVRNFETCLQRARGRWIHLLHGDDLVRPGFYARMREAFEAEPGIGAAFCRTIYIDERGRPRGHTPIEQPESGILKNALEHLALEQRIMTPSIVVRRDVYEALGAFDTRLRCSEDWEMWVRVASAFPIWYQAEPLAMYRMHSDSNTGRHVQSGEDILFTRLAIDIFERYLPRESASRIARTARETYAMAAVDMARTLALRGDRAGMGAQIRAALGCSRSPRVMWRATRLLVRAAAGSLAAAGGVERAPGGRDGN
jgi:glycosyltransferase involved in cell wall biosynthesis